jgi:diadenosine tetraphosphate (Ap4A) HIT family hydrolase
MYNHAPEDYDCPFCRLVRSLNTVRSSQKDIVYRDDDVTAFLSASWWPNNPGHVLVVPNEHYENMYLHRRSDSMPEEWHPHATRLKEFLARRAVE